MESFSLLKYWRGGGGKASAVASANMPTTTIAASVLRPSEETEDTEDDDDEGPFFDLEFAVPDDGSDEEELGNIAGAENDESAVNWEAEDEEEEEGEFKFAVSPDGHSSDPSLSLSPSDDLFFKGRLVPLEPTNSLAVTAAEPDSKPPPQFPVSLLRSATKLRVRMLRFRKSKSAPAESGDAPAAPSKQQQQMSKFFVKFKVVEVPIVSLFTRDNSSRTTGRAERPHAEDPTPPPTAEAAEERRFSKEAVQKYLNKIKPLYVKVSKRYGEKLRFSGLLTPDSDSVVGKDEKEQADGDGETEAPAGGALKNQKTIMPAGLRVVCKRLGKSKSAPSAVAAAPPPPPPPPPPQRRDDSLLQQQDGIQSAIAHCKRSFNAARGSESPLARSMSDPGDGERSEKEDKGSLPSNPYKL